jgi:hypothetical protein
MDIIKAIIIISAPLCYCAIVNGSQLVSNFLGDGGHNFFLLCYNNGSFNFRKVDGVPITTTILLHFAEYGHFPQSIETIASTECTVTL